MRKIFLILILIACCNSIWGQTDSLHQRSVEYFFSQDINLQKKDTIQTEKFYYIRNGHTENEEFKEILQTVSEIRPYKLIFMVYFMRAEGKQYFSFVQCEDHDELISYICQGNLKIEGCITLNNAKFYLIDKTDSKSLIDKLLVKNDSYTAIMKMNYPIDEDIVLFAYIDNLPMYVIDEKGHISKYQLEK